MKNNFRALVFGLMSLLLFSCNESEPIEGGTKGKLTGEVTRF